MTTILNELYEKIFRTSPVRYLPDIFRCCNLQNEFCAEHSITYMSLYMLQPNHRLKK
jgi:hypothetical protein